MGLITDGLLKDKPSADVKLSSGKFFGLNRYSVEASAIGHVRTENKLKEGELSVSAEGSLVESAKSSWIVGKNASVYALRSNKLMNASLKWESGDAPTVTVKPVENVFSVGIITKNHTIGLRLDLTMPNILRNPFKKATEDAGAHEPQKTFPSLPIQIVFKKNNS